MRSGRLHECPTIRRRRVLCLHKHMIHAPDDVTCYAVQGTKSLCKNTNITAVWDIRSVFRHSPCFICVVLVKKRKEGMAQLKSRTQQNTRSHRLKSSTADEMNSQTPSGTSPGNCSAATTLDPLTPSHLRDMSSHLNGEIQAPSV